MHISPSSRLRRLGQSDCKLQLTGLRLVVLIVFANPHSGALISVQVIIELSFVQDVVLSVVHAEHSNGRIRWDYYLVVNA